MIIYHGKEKWNLRTDLKKMIPSMMLKAFKYAFEKDLKVIIRNFLLAVED